MSLHIPAQAEQLLILDRKKEIFMEDIFAVIGKMYLDLLQSQKIIESLQKKLEDRENDISSLQASIISKDNIM